MRDALTQSAQVAQEVHKGALTAGVVTTSAGVATALQWVTVGMGLLATTAGLVLTVYLTYKAHLDVKLRKMQIAEVDDRRNGNGNGA